MRVAFMMAVVALLPSLYSPAPQTSDEDAIKAVVLAETKAFFDRDERGWQSQWLHDANVTRTIVSNGNYNSGVGWDDVSATMTKFFAANPQKVNVTVKNDRFIVRKDGNIAWVEYVQQIVSPESTFDKDESREQRVLVKAGEQWKIASQVTHVTSTFGNTPEAIEATINNAGYALLAGKKPEEAIEAFKLNVRLYPKSWNAYDSLGEAYVEAGQKDLAIKNYEKSVELNPKNEAGLAALKKLRQP